MEMGRFCRENAIIGVRIAPMSSRRKMVQLSFADRPTKKGTARKKPGPKAAARAAVRHRTRPVHRAYHPLHVTMRAVRGLPSFRQQQLFAAFERAFRTTRREDFRIVEYSVQDNHVHMLVEANENEALARGMKSFSVRANRLFNTALGSWARASVGRSLSSPYAHEPAPSPERARVLPEQLQEALPGHERRPASRSVCVGFVVRRLGERAHAKGIEAETHGGTDDVPSSHGLASAWVPAPGRSPAFDALVTESQDRSNF